MHQFLRIPMATLAERPGLFDSIIYQLTGLFVVFTALGSIWLIMELLGVIFKRIHAAEAAKLARSAILEPAPIEEAGIPPETMVVIAAAVHDSLQGAARIVSISPVSADGSPTSAWSGEGRRSHFASHKVR